MSDENEPDETVEVEETTDETDETGDESDNEGNEPDEQTGTDSQLTDDALRKELTNVRAEAARYRVKLREAEAKLSAAKSPEEVEAAITALREDNAKLERALLVNEVARRHGLPDDLAARLSGSTKEELDADAKLLAKYATPEEPDHLEGGLDPRGEIDDEPDDPRALARKYGRGRKRA